MNLGGKLIKEAISTKNAPAAVGAYSQAIAAGQMIFVSGQLGLFPGTKEFAGKTIEEQTQQAMENIAAILNAAGSSLEQVVKMSISLKDINEFSKFNETYATFFQEDPPARAVFEVSNLPLNGLIEIETIALRD